MRIDQLDRFSPEEKKNQETETPKKRGVEIQKTPEDIEKKEVGTAEAVVFAGLLGLKAYLFYDSKKEEIRKVVDETKKDIQTQPAELKPIIGTSILRLGSLFLDHEREKKEQKLTIRQKFADSMHELVAKRSQFEMLNDYEKLQQEGIIETLKSPVEITGLNEEDKIKLREKIKITNEVKNKEVRKKFEGFIDSLLKTK